MPNPLVCELDETRELNAADCDEVLRQAAADAAPVRLLVACGPKQQVVRAELVGQDRHSLLVRLQDSPEPPDALAQSPAVHVTLSTAETPYVFETVCLRASVGDAATVLRLRRPAKLSVIERRRTGRKTLHEPAEVAIAYSDGSSAFTCRAAMLNVSAEGLACRVSSSDARQLAVGKEVRARFCIGDDPSSYNMICRITNETAGGTPGAVVLGMQFVQEKNSPLSQSRIWAALRSSD